MKKTNGKDQRFKANKPKKSIVKIEKNRRTGLDYTPKKHFIENKKIDNFSKLAQKSREKKVVLKQKVWDELDRQVLLMDRLTPHKYSKREHIANLIMDARISRVDFTEKNTSQKASQQERRKKEKT